MGEGPSPRLMKLLGASAVAVVAAAGVAYVVHRRVLQRKKRPRGILVRDAAARRKSSTRARWDEETLQQHETERGVLYGTMKIDHPDTPYLYYNKEKETVLEYVKGQPPKEVEVPDLQARLGVLHLAQETGEDVTPQAAEAHETAEARERRLAFEKKRREHYKREAPGKR